MAVSVTNQNKAWKGDRECRGRELQLQIEWSGKPQWGDRCLSGSRVSQAEGRAGAGGQCAWTEWVKAGRGEVRSEREQEMGPSGTELVGLCGPLTVTFVIKFQFSWACKKLWERLGELQLLGCNYSRVWERKVTLPLEQGARRRGRPSLSPVWIVAALPFPVETLDDYHFCQLSAHLHPKFLRGRI